MSITYESIRVLGLEILGLDDIDSNFEFDSLVAWSVLQHSRRRLTPVRR